VNCTDLIASWEHESYFYKQAFGEQAPCIEFKLILKLGHHVYEESETNEHLNTMFNEACYTFKNLHCPLTYDDLIKLHAMEIQINFGDWDEQRQKFVVENYYQHLANYKCKYEEDRDEATVVTALGEAYKGFSGTKRNDCKKAYIELVKGFGMMGYILYVVKVIFFCLGAYWDRFKRK
jgi:acyl-CoA-binding protein